MNNNLENNYISEIDKYYLREAALDCLKEYEKSVNNYQISEIINNQEVFLNFIDTLIETESTGNCSTYFTALIYMREDLLQQMQIIDKRKNHIVINDVTIIPNFELNSDRFNTNVEPELKKLKTSFNTEEKTDKLRIAIQNTLVLPNQTGFSDIAGMTDIKVILKEAIVFPIQYPHLFTGGRKKWNKLLLYGPPGTGKTQLVHCLAAEVNAQLYNVSNSDLLSSYVGESEKLVKTLFKHCNEIDKQCLIFIDEIDSFCRVRNSKESELERRFKNQLLTELSEMDRNPNNKIFFLACTNCPWDLDPAFIRRFQRRIYVPLPNRETRFELLQIQTKLQKGQIVKSEWESILNSTNGWSGSDISDLVNSAMLMPVKELHSATNWIITKDLHYMPVKDSDNHTLKKNLKDLPPNRVTVRPVEYSDFEKALQNVTKTVTYESLKKFEKFNTKFGSLKVNS